MVRYLGMQRSSAEVMSGKEVQTKPEPRPKDLVPQVADKRGMDAISKGIMEFLNPKSLPVRNVPPPRGRFGRSSRMSPLSGTGIPGLGNIKTYSTPGGIESLYRKS